jgi:hypothetical protein
MFIKMGAVKFAKSVGAIREMRGHPIENDPDLCRVSRFDESCKTWWLSEAPPRREKRDRLIPPGSVEGIFGDRQELYVGNAHVSDIRDKAFGEFTVGEIAVAIFGYARPGTEMAFIN